MVNALVVRRNTQLAKAQKVLRAAQYVRMSTELQRYSIQNQAAAIAAYAQQRNLTIVRTYVDEGRSGVRINGRAGLIELIEGLWSVDAPESSQLCRGADSNLRCGAAAANDLDTLIAQRPVNCTPVSEDQYGRSVATCSVGGTDLGEWLVRNGLALDWPQYSKGRYAAAERDADHSGRRMWAGSYVEPWLFRKCIRAGGTPTNCSDDANAHP